MLTAVQGPFPGALMINSSLTANLRSATAGALGAKTTQRRSCGHEEDPAVTAAATRELAPQVRPTCRMLDLNAKVQQYSQWCTAEHPWTSCCSALSAAPHMTVAMWCRSQL